MTNRTPTPYQAGFWLTRQEQHYLLFICILSLLGLAGRFYYAQPDKPAVRQLDEIVLQEHLIHE